MFLGGWLFLVASPWWRAELDRKQQRGKLNLAPADFSPVATLPVRAIQAGAAGPDEPVDGAVFSSGGCRAGARRFLPGFSAPPVRRTPADSSTREKQTFYACRAEDRYGACGHDGDAE